MKSTLKDTCSGCLYMFEKEVVIIELNTILYIFTEKITKIINLNKKNTKHLLSCGVFEKSYDSGQAQNTGIYSKNDVINLIKLCNAKSYKSCSIPALNHRSEKP